MSAGKHGMVYLVGGGPGDPGLLTLRAYELLQIADVVVHDRLVSPIFLNFAPGAEWIDAGKQPGHHQLPQEQINELLVGAARQGKIVVRLKGGDPFVFGRGGEEAAALHEAGIPFEIVPGVTSAIAAPAYAGIPLTYRNLACSAAIITGHRADCGANPEAEWQRVARGADTLVFLMGVHNLENIVAQLITAGRSPDTPIALVEQGTTSSQRTVTGTLADIVAAGAVIRPPATIVVGEVVRLRQTLRWFDLQGSQVQGSRRIAVLQAAPARDGETAPVQPFLANAWLSRQLAPLGVQLTPLPAYHLAQPAEVAGLDRAILALRDGSPASRWLVFLDSEVVPFFFKRLAALGGDARWLAGTLIAVANQRIAWETSAYGITPDQVWEDGDSLESRLESLPGDQVILSAIGLTNAPILEISHDDRLQTLLVATATPTDDLERRLGRLRQGGCDALLVPSQLAASVLLALTGSQPLDDILQDIPLLCMEASVAALLEQAGVSPLRICLDGSEPELPAVLAGRGGQPA